jgi:hypothetical protein
MASKAQLRVKICVLALYFMLFSCLQIMDNYGGFEVLTTVIMKVAIFWQLVARWFLAGLIFNPEDGGDTFLQNVRSYTEYAALCPRRYQL